MTHQHPDKRDLRRQYKETPRPAGVFAVSNVAEKIALLGTSTDVPSMLNRQRFQLEMGIHPLKELQEDWCRLGSDAFAFETLDRLNPDDDSERDLKEELLTLKDLWSTKLEAEGHRFYANRRSAG